MKIHGLMAPISDKTFYEEGFMIALEAQLSYLKSLPTNRAYTVTPHIANKHKGDFYGLLDHLDIPKKYHYLILLINNLLSSSDYSDSQLTIILPDVGEIDLIKAVYNTRPDMS